MTEFEKLVGILINNIASDFGSALKARIDARNKELEDIKTKKETNEEVLEKIEEKKRKKKASRQNWLGCPTGWRISHEPADDSTNR